MLTKQVRGARDGVGVRQWGEAAILVACALASHGGADAPRQRSVALSGPNGVVAGGVYLYTIVVTNDGGAWPASGHALRLVFDLHERCGEGTVGIEDILVHPVGPQGSDGAFPCDAHGDCWFRRSGSRVDFSFTRDNAVVGPVSFDVIIHTASVFRAGNSFQLSATLQDDRQSAIDGYPIPVAPDGRAGAAIVATFPLACGDISADCSASSLR